jgi:uncharacterized protein (TIGR03118 family)
VGNFGDGRINAFDPTTLAFAGALRGPGGKPVVIDGLWALLPGNGTEGSTHDVLYTAGPQDEARGLLGLLHAAPSPVAELRLTAARSECWSGP